MIKIEIAEDIKAFVKDVQERLDGQFNVYVAGGSLRDIYCDKPIKDIDVFFVPCNGVTQDVGYIPAKFYVNYNKRLSNLTNTSDMASRGVSQVIGLFNGSLSTSEVQFIVYSKHLTMQEVAEDMDINLCQIVWSPVDESIYHTVAFCDGHENKYIQCLHDYDKIRTYDRYERMEDKFTDYTVLGKPSPDVLPVEDQFSAKIGTYKPRVATGSIVDS